MPGLPCAAGETMATGERTSLPPWRTRGSPPPCRNSALIMPDHHVAARSAGRFEDMLRIVNQRSEIGTRDWDTGYIGRIRMPNQGAQHARGYRHVEPRNLRGRGYANEARKPAKGTTLPVSPSGLPRIRGTSRRRLNRQPLSSRTTSSS